MMIYDNSTGIFDQTYSAAWSLGRALGLADGTFSQALMRYRKKSYTIIGQLMDALESADEASSTDLSEVVQSSVVRDTFKQLVSQDVGLTLTQISEDPAAAQDANTTVDDQADGQEDPVAVTRSFLAEPAVQEFLQSEVQNELIPIAKWLAQRQLLCDVPFNHLVPDQLELPVESLRFFYMDQNWLDSLVDGALGIGVQSSKDSFLNEVMRGVINDAIATETKAIRDNILGTATGDVEADSTLEALSGILIRSAVVSGWPGLVVKGFKGDYATGTQVKMLRMDRLSSNVLLCIFLDIPDTIMLAEPQQGICFGIEDGDVIGLRQLSNPPGKPTGTDFPAPATGGFASFFRATSGDVGDSVLNLNDGANSVVQTMQGSKYLGTTIGPAQFALEMVKAPEEISFKPQTS